MICQANAEIVQVSSKAVVCHLIAQLFRLFISQLYLIHGFDIDLTASEYAVYDRACAIPPDAVIFGDSKIHQPPLLQGICFRVPVAMPANTAWICKLFPSALWAMFHKDKPDRTDPDTTIQRYPHAGLFLRYSIALPADDSPKHENRAPQLLAKNLTSSNFILYGVTVG